MQIAMYVPQKQLANLRSLIQPGKVIVIYGARRVGKTTLLHKFVENLDPETVLFVNGDDITARQFLESQSIENLKDFVRNAVVGMFNPLNLRNDTGKIWENYAISEFHKHREYQRQSSSFYFWRTYDRKEIDLVEETAGKLSGYEIKWKKGRVSAPKDWYQNYPQASFKVINQGNYLNYILKRDDKR